ncbi:MAG: TetR/AcrR family transcriptional regulator [Thermoleophilaceae bacterium]
MSEPAYRRLDVDERRAQLLELGTELFTKHAYDELSMAAIAREAGISKALLYHYFPSKEEYFKATLADAVADLVARTQPPADLAPVEELRHRTRAFVEWVGERRESYVKLLQSAGSVPEVGELITNIRDVTSRRILEGLLPKRGRTPRARAAVRGWLWFMDGVLLDWIEHGDREADEVADSLIDSLTALLPG